MVLGDFMNSLFSRGGWSVIRFPEWDADGQMCFAVVDPIGRIREAVSAQHFAYAFRVARGMVRFRAKCFGF